MHGARNYFSYLLCLSSSCQRLASQPIKSKYLFRARRPPTSGLATPTPTGPKNRPLVLAILCLYRYTLAALTALARLGPVLCL